MLVEFTVGNYLSFKEKAKLELTASIDTELINQNVFKVNNDLKLLRSAIIYGLNASGKSNLLDGMHFMKQFVINSFKEMQVDSKIKVTPFKLSSETEDKPSFFEMIFLIDGDKYRYNFELDKEKIYSENLFVTLKDTRESYIYKRNEKEFKINAKHRKFKKFTENTRENSLFISLLAQFNIDIAKDIIKYFGKLTIISGEYPNDFRTKKMLFEREYKSLITEVLKSYDLTIDKISLEMPNIDEVKQEIISGENDIFKNEILKMLNEGRIPYEAFSKVKLYHKKYDLDKKQIENIEMDFSMTASSGTQHLFSLIGPMIDALINDKVLIVDEFFSQLHPILMQELLIKFMKYKENNDKKSFSNAKSQLIFTNHNTSLMKNDLFRRDQIIFAQKNEYGATELLKLYDFRDEKGERVRKDLAYEKNYLNGNIKGLNRPIIDKFL